MELIRNGNSGDGIGDPSGEGLHEPPATIPHVLCVSSAGLGLCLVSLLLGMGDSDASDHSFKGTDLVRVVLTLIGLIVVGAGVTLRPGWYGSWLFLGIAGVLNYGFGTDRFWIASVPHSWDSMQYVGMYLAMAGFIGSALQALPRPFSYSFGLLFVLYHFSSIFSAVASPPPTPWMAGQYWQRVARFYLIPAYLNNAYQFYSPDPGPAREIWMCVIYQDENGKRYDGAPDKAVEGEHYDWVILPRRGENNKDPLGLLYYRKLGTSEQLSAAGGITTPAEYEQINLRRSGPGEYIPRHPNPSLYNQQFRPVPDSVLRQILPSYVIHAAHHYANPARKVHSIKVYMVTHEMIALEHFRPRHDPVTVTKYREKMRNALMTAKGDEADRMIRDLEDSLSREKKVRQRADDPLLYLPYFQGEFTPEGKLVDSIDPLLNWVVPIIEKNDIGHGDRRIDMPNLREHYFEYVSSHAGFPLKVGVRR